MKNKSKHPAVKSKRAIHKSTTHLLGTKRGHKKTARKVVKSKIRKSRPVHKRILLHPVTVFAVLCCLVMICAWTYKVVADSVISATIEAPTLAQGANITDPADDSTLTQTPATLSGTCPTNSYVKIYDNSLFIGATVCADAGTFQIEAELFKGENSLIAQAFNATDEQGPATPSITVTLKLPHAATSTTSSSGSVSPTTSSSSTSSNADTAPPPILLTSDFHYQTFDTGSVFKWQMDLEGGVPPYKVHIVWGDGNSSDLVFKTDPVFNISHTYTKQGYFSIKVYSTDTVGNHHMMQLAALIKKPGTVGFLNTTGSTPTRAGACKPDPSAANVDNLACPPPTGVATLLDNSKIWLLLAWPSIIIIGLMIFSFWLGEQEEVRFMLARRHTSHR